MDLFQQRSVYVHASNWLHQIFKKLWMKLKLCHAPEWRRKKSPHLLHYSPAVCECVQHTFYISRQKMQLFLKGKRPKNISFTDLK